MWRLVISALLLLCSDGIAFQARSLENKVSIKSRIRPPVVRVEGSVPIADLSVSVPLVLIPTHVTNGMGQPVTGLTKEHFLLFDNDVEQNISDLAYEEAPISIGLLFDTSGSMQKKMARSIEAVKAFFKTANPSDEFFLVQFGEHAKLAIPFTSDPQQIYRAVVRTHPFGRTALLDAIHLALLHMKTARNTRKALVILSDGADNRSRFSASEVRNVLVESDAQLYAIGIFDRSEPNKLPSDERGGPQLLETLAADSGGKLYTASDLNELPAISTQISRDLRDQYILGYAPYDRKQDGKYHHIRLRLKTAVDRTDLRVFYRRGYYAPK